MFAERIGGVQKFSFVIWSFLSQSLKQRLTTPTRALILAHEANRIPFTCSDLQQSC